VRCCCSAFIILHSSLLCAAELQPVGVIGNSGEAGAGLVRANPRGGYSGAALDSDGTLWLSGGDALNRVGLDGHLIERFPLEPNGSLVDSRSFAVLDGQLYFFVGSGKTTALFALPMRSGATAKALPLKLPERRNEWERCCLAPQPYKKQLVLAANAKAADQGATVFLLNPTDGAIKPAFTIKGAAPQGVAVDEKREVIYVGASNIFAVKPDGTVLPGFPVACTKTPAIPTSFNGVISLANDSLWETAWYGFLSRLDLHGNAAPGRVVQWHHDLDYPAQVLALNAAADGQRGSSEALLITTPYPWAYYFACWDGAQQELRLLRRIGCLPHVYSLGLSEDGWITVGLPHSQLWWKWDDGGAAPVRQADIHIAATPGFFRGEEFFALAKVYHVNDQQNKTCIPAEFSRRMLDRNEARRVGEWVPMKQPVGLAVQEPIGKSGAFLLATDAASKQLWRTPFNLGNLTPEDKWQAVPVEGDGLRAPTDIVALRDGRVLLADEGSIMLLEPAANGFKTVWRWEKWGDTPDACFGKRLRMAVDGTNVLVSDSDRHRVVWLDWAERKLLAICGETDKPGDDAKHLNAPTFVALSGTRAVVADSGNQRVVKIVLKP